ncbi:hypothetical protein FUAX_39260 (plasmid) [Fulvitalea axinellae]|uniref:DUF5034 domain-containing protein n=1 Tax=Fulvitalea axinellae TaxID=1182444 RepID=A0AAU9DA93_9BACT|nr:hypothetical protein FUAX_39260 [Fulvitalea axinellae]
MGLTDKLHFFHNILPKAIGLMAIPFFIQVLASCNVSTCTGDSTYHLYNLCDISLTHIDNSGEKPVASETADISNYILRINTDLTLAPCATPSTSAGIIPKAQAMSPVCPEEVYTLFKSVEKITVKTLTDINEDYPADSDVSDLFAGKEENSMQSLDHYVAMFREKEHIDYESLASPFELYLAQTLEPGIYRFEVSIILENERALTAISKPVTLQ